MRVFPADHHAAVSTRPPALLLATVILAAAGPGRANRPPPVPVAAAPPPLAAPQGAPDAVPVAPSPPALTASANVTAVPASGGHPAAPAPSRPVQTARLALFGLMDRGVTGRDNATIGHIIDVLVDPDGRPEAVLVEAGGFLGIGQRKIAVGWADVSFSEHDPSGPVKVNMTLDEVRSAPAFDGNGPTIIAVGPAEPLAGPPEIALAPAPLPAPRDTAPSTLPAVAAPPPPLALPRRVRPR